MNLSVSTSEWTPTSVGSPHDTLKHALECAKRKVRHTQAAIDVWLCDDDGKRRILLAHLRPGKCTLTNSGHIVQENCG